MPRHHGNQQSYSWCSHAIWESIVSRILQCLSVVYPAQALSHPQCQEILDLVFQLPGESDYLFHYKDGRTVTTDTYEQNLSRRCKRLGISTTNNHAFRIAFNSHLIKLGFHYNNTNTHASRFYRNFFTVKLLLSYSKYRAALRMRLSFTFLVPSYHVATFGALSIETSFVPQSSSSRLWLRLRHIFS